MEIARGHVTDKPFARIVYTLAARRFTGDLILEQGGREYRVALEDGAVTAAQSANPSDQAVRVALTAGLVDSTSVSEALRQAAADPKRDQLEVLAAVGRLSPQQVVGLKRRLLAARAARLFALADATYALESARTMSADPEVPPIDLRWLVHYGVRTHYPIERLEREMKQVASYAFQLARDAHGSLPAFGFGEAEKALLAKLRQRPMTIAEIEQSGGGLDRHAVLALIYALVACDCLSVSRPSQSQKQQAEAAPRSPQPRVPTERAVVPPPQAKPAPDPSPSHPAAAPPSQGFSRHQKTRRGPPGHRARPRTTTQAGTPRARRGKPTASVIRVPGLKSGQKVTADEVRELIQTKAQDLDEEADYFALLGVTREAMDQEINAAYFKLAKRLHPDRLQALGLGDLRDEAQRVFATVNQAFAVLSKPQERARYRQTLGSGGPRSDADAQELAARLFAAEEHFKRGEMALRRSHFSAAQEEFEKAVELNPDDAEHHALLAWATWCAAPDKQSIAKTVNKELARALSMADNCVPAWFYRGQVAKQQGKADAALQCFDRVLELDPKHHEAQMEARMLRSRQSKEPEKKGGLFGRKR